VSNDTSDIYQNSDTDGDETLPIIKISKPQKRGNTKNKMEGLKSKKTKEPVKKANHKGNIKFWNPLLSREAYQIN
jgi:hypothetical protein